MIDLEEEFVQNGGLITLAGRPWYALEVDLREINDANPRWESPPNLTFDKWFGEFLHDVAVPLDHYAQYLDPDFDMECKLMGNIDPL